MARSYLAEFCNAPAVCKGTWYNGQKLVLCEGCLLKLEAVTDAMGLPPMDGMFFEAGPDDTCDQRVVRKEASLAEGAD